jgi:hypothetical protein
VSFPSNPLPPRRPPYCDIVITENFWRGLLIRSGLGKKYNPVVLGDVKRLEKYP